MNGALCTRSMFSNTKDWAQRAAALRHQLQDAWHDVQEEDGLLFTKNFLALLRKLRYQPKTARANKTGYVPATDVEAVAALQAMGMTQYHIQDGVFLRYSTMEKWYLTDMLGERGDLRNKLLLRPGLGVGRRTTYMLPPAETAYGDASKPDGVTVWSLVHNEYSKPSEKDGGLWDKDQQTFPGIQPHPAQPSIRPGSSFRRIKESATFGRQSGQHMPIVDVVEHRALPHFKAGLELALQPTTATMYAPGAENKKVPGRLPPPRPTRSSLALAESNRYRFAHLHIEGHAAAHAKPFDHQAAFQASYRPQSARW